MQRAASGWVSGGLCKTLWSRDQALEHAWAAASRALPGEEASCYRPFPPGSWQPWSCQLERLISQCRRAMPRGCRPLGDGGRSSVQGAFPLAQAVCKENGILPCSLGCGGPAEEQPPVWGRAHPGESPASAPEPGRGGGHGSAWEGQTDGGQAGGCHFGPYGVTSGLLAQVCPVLQRGRENKENKARGALGNGPLLAALPGGPGPTSPSATPSSPGTRPGPARARSRRAADTARPGACSARRPFAGPWASALCAQTSGSAPARAADRLGGGSQVDGSSIGYNSRTICSSFWGS